MKIKKLCIIAGQGDLPEFAADEAIEKKINFCVYFLDTGNTRFADRLQNMGIEYQQVNPGNFDLILKKLVKDEISHVLFVGKVSKIHLFKGIKFNLKTIKLLKQLKDRNDKSIFNLLVSELEKIKIEILKQDFFLKSLLCKPGIYSKRKPSKTEMEDIRYGMNFARIIAALDIGQTVVVANKTLLSIEAIEGTDEAIKRGASFAHNKNPVVCKVMRKNQDTRFDVPAVGLHTLEIMRKNNCRVLAIEAGHTFVVCQKTFFKKVNEYRMVFLSMDLKN